MAADKTANERKLNKKMIERIIIMHNLIKSGVYPNIAAIKKHYLSTTGYKDVGEATIYRDINTLQVNFKAPLEFDRQRNGYYYMDDNWEFALNQISTDEVFYLSSAKTLLSSFEGTPMYREIADVIDFVTDTQTAGKSALLKRIAIPPTPKVIINDDTWDVVMSALRGNFIIEFDYNGRWNTATTHRRVRPYQILLQDGMYFLFGWDENASNKGNKAAPEGAERLFCMNRIKNLSRTGTTFRLPENFDFTSRCSGGKFGAFMESHPDRYVIVFKGPGRQYVKDCIWADDQVITDDDEALTTTITFTSAQSQKVLEWVLAQGRFARPTSPEWFVKCWKDEILGMAEMADLSD